MVISRIEKTALAPQGFIRHLDCANFEMVVIPLRNWMGFVIQNCIKCFAS